MGSAFSRSERSLAADPARQLVWKIFVAAALLGAWGTWFSFAHVAVYESSTAARLEVERAAHPIATTLSGRIVANQIVVGKHVERGALLVELDAELEHRRLDEERRRLAGLVPQMAAAQRELVALEQTQADAHQAAQVTFEEARARHQAADTESRLASDEEQRLDKLHAKGALSDLAIVRARAEAEKQKSSADAQGLDVKRLESEQRTYESQARARMEQLRRDIAMLESERETTTAAVAVIEQSIERHHVRAPIEGEIGESENLTVGDVVREGERLGTVIPTGGLRVVAEFEPAAALGRVRIGQRARLLLDGFPWTQYGSIDAVVSAVSVEVRDGRVRVELDPRRDSGARIPLQHGLPGTAEVEVERITPAALVLRTAGKMLTRSADGTP